MLACYLLMAASSGGAATHSLNYFPYNAYFSSYSAYAPYSSYGPYGCYGCYGCYGGYAGFDPHFSFGCYGGNGCYGWTPPFCAGPPVVHCWSGPVMPMADAPTGNGNGGQALSPEQKLDQMLKGIEQMRKDGMKINEKLLQLEEELIKLKKALPPKGPQPGVAPGGKGAEEAAAPLLKDRALFRIKLPAGAKLYVEGQLTETNGKNERVLVTPKLATGVHYSYTFRAVSVVDGASVTQTRTVTFQVGQEIPVDLESAEPVATESE